MKKYQFNTRVIHAGQQPCPNTGAIMTPIYATSTYVQKSPGEHLGYEYSRTQNPTRSAYEACIASLENGLNGFAFASGMAAITAILELLDYDSHIIASADLYGGTHRIFTQLKNRTAKLAVSMVNLNDLKAVEELIQPNTKMLWLETPSNPMLNITDIEALAEFAKKHRLLLVVDNTFASPYLQQPLMLGADIVVHSATKYLGGHSDIIGGVVITNDDSMSQKLGFIQNTTGGICSPQDAFTILRSLKTLSIRMQRHCENAKLIANFLNEHPKIKVVYYPGLKSHPGHQIACRQMRDFGGMISFELNANLSETKKFLTQCQIFSLAESLGGVESLIEHPAIMTHAAVPAKERAQLGIHDNFIRLSVGIEDSQDLIEDLSQALDVVAN